jgi:hypothetical protein
MGFITKLYGWTSKMRNKYPGKCYRCGKIVERQKGHFERFQRGWRVQHAECAIKYRLDAK